MMDLQALRESVSGVLRSECSLEKVRRHVNGELDLQDSLLPIAGDLGWAALCVPEAHGGLGFGAEGLCAIGEELGRALAPGALGVLVLAARLLAEFAPEPLRKRYLDRAMAGELSVALDASLKPGSTGASRLVLGGPRGDLLLIALPGQDGRDAELGLVELGQAPDALVERPAWDGTRRLSAAVVEGLPIHALGPAAYRAAVRLSALMIASDSLGLAEALTAMTVEYLCVREQFGKKLGSFQAIKHRIADLVIGQYMNRARIEAAAADDPGAAPEAATLWSLLCKAEATDAAAFCAEECLQLHGGIGFTWEHGCHLFLKRARLNQALLGDNGQIRAACAQTLPKALGSAKEARLDAVH
jgi:alkylation response protein AidB-like acyl-CoA dehydrogenase